MIELSTTTSTTVVTVSGDLDMSERAHFPDVVTRVNELRRSELVIDLCRAGFVDTSGAWFLVSLAERTQSRQGVSVLRGADDRSLYVLDVLGALRMFQVNDQHFCVDADAGTGTSALDGAGMDA